jgi:hypothetical protein
MLARRVIAITPDKALAKRLGLGLRAAGGSVETYSSLESLPKGDLQAALVVLHLDDGGAETLADVSARLRADARIIAVLPKSDLTLAVAVMQESERVAGVLIADELPTEALSAMATRVLYGDIFGVEKVVPWGTRIYSALVGDYQEKSVCIAEISEFAASMGVRRKYREAIEQCLDEMLMNALYDAPVDSQGKQIFADIPTKTRISLRMEQKAVVQYACDGDTFTLSVRDSFGTLDRDTVLRYLHKCLHSEQQIDRKTGGAGLGLYIMANATTQFVFNVLPGVATECLCTFDLTAPKVQLKRFGFFDEKIDAAGRLVAGPSKLHPAGYPVDRREPAPVASRAVLGALSAAIVLLLALIALVAYPRIARPTAPVAIVTDPPGAIIEIDGRARGASEGGQLEVDGLAVGRAYRVVARLDGWEPAEAILEPVKGQTASVTLSLEPKAAVVSIDSDPQGAAVLHEGVELGVTPMSATTLPAGDQVELTFRRPGYRDVVRSVRVPSRGSEAFLSVTLSMAPDMGSVRIETTPPGALVYQNDELLAGVLTPVDEHIIQADRPYRFTFKVPGYMPATVEARVEAGERGVPVAATLKPGGSLTIRANIEGRVELPGVRPCHNRRLPLVDCPLPNGRYKVTVTGTRPYARQELTVVVDRNEVTHDLQFGFVQAAEGSQLAARGRTYRRLAFPEGNETVTLVDDETGETQRVEVRVQPGRTVTIP